MNIKQLLTALWAVVFPLALFAQENKTHTLSGVVLSEDREVIPFVQIRIIQPLSNDTVYAPTDWNGGFTVNNLPSGKYVLEVNKFGYQLLSIGLNISNDTILDTLFLSGAFNWKTADYRNDGAKLLQLAETLSKDIDGLYDDRFGRTDIPNYEILAKIYYNDFIKNESHIKRVFTHNADSALKYCTYCYWKDKEEYDFMYYPIHQLENYLKKPFDSTITPPNYTKTYLLPYRPDIDNPEGWMKDHSVDHLKASISSISFEAMANDYLVDLDESPLSDYSGETTVVRLTTSSAWGWTDCLRVCGNKMVFKNYDWMMSQLERNFELTISEKEVEHLKSLLPDNGIPPLKQGQFVIDGGNRLLEFLNNGKHHYCFTRGKKIIPVVDTIISYVNALYQKYTYCITLVNENWQQFDSVELRNTDSTIVYKTRFHYWSSRPRLELHGMPPGKYTITVIDDQKNSKTTTAIVKKDTEIEL
ncbi:MAG: carboxypeptidase regulatory-like domain-containing protein [Bacteroidales bacterium]|nr:carboxypeptidase regulatory-like domain-containing protein [Bacteroidales bacterium]